MRTRKLARALLGNGLASRLNEIRNYHRTIRSPDRVDMRTRILPAFADLGGNILFIGCRRYTAGYPVQLERSGAACWTTDIDPGAARYGRAGRHETGDICSVRPFTGTMFDGVLCNGVLGFGVNDPGDQRRCLATVAELLKPGGVLLLGWNTDRIADPIAAGLHATWFEPVPFGGFQTRHHCSGTTHVYDFLRRKLS